MPTDITTRAAFAGSAPAPDRRHVAAGHVDQTAPERMPLDPMAPDIGLRPYLRSADVFRDTNYAVAADIVGAALARTRVRASASGIPPEGTPTSEPRHSAVEATGLDCGALRTFDLIF